MAQSKAQQSKGPDTPADPPEGVTAATEETSSAGTEYIVTATSINRVVNGRRDPLGYGQKVTLDPNHPDTIRWLAAKALTLANPDTDQGTSGDAPLPLANTNVTADAPNGAGDGQPSSVQDSDPNRPQGQHTAPDGPAGAAGTPAGEDGQGVPVS